MSNEKYFKITLKATEDTLQDILAFIEAQKGASAYDVEERQRLGFSFYWKQYANLGDNSRDEEEND